MTARRAVLLALLVVAAAVAQVSVFNRLALPRARPDLLLVVVGFAGIAGGRTTGTVSGFAAGLLLDVMPPAEHAIGVFALVYAVVGYLSGTLNDFPPRPLTVLLALVAVAGLSALALALAGALDLLTGAPPAWPALARETPLLAGYDVALALLVVPPLAWIGRRLAPVAAGR